MKTTAILAVSAVCLFIPQISAGDAVAIGFNKNGIWTAVTYSCSSKPRGNPEHYRNAAQACTAAEKDLHVRAKRGLVRVKIIDQSDRSGYVAVGRGRKTSMPHEVSVVGRGKSQVEADEQVMKLLRQSHASTDEQIIFRYFSYGADSAPVTAAIIN
jgi:hypothetical protein